MNVIKCLCGFEVDGKIQKDKRVFEDEKFIEIDCVTNLETDDLQLDGAWYKVVSRYDSNILYACPKCGTVKFKI